MSDNANLVKRIKESENLSDSTKKFLTTLLDDYLSEKETEDLMTEFAEAHDAD